LRPGLNRANAFGAFMQRLLWVCLCGALGTGVRYLLGLWAGQRFSGAFPFGTLIVNLAGCFLIALVLRLSMSMASFPAGLRVALTTGFLGGLTTYSAFNFETTSLWLDGARRAALLNFGVTTAGCLIAGLLGLALASKWVGG
jgi:CrcB protein